MQVTTLDTKATNRPWFAIADAQRRNSNNASFYTPEQRASAQRALDIIDLAYAYKASFINFRQRFIAIKLDQAIAKDKKMVKEVDAILSEKGFTKAISAQGCVYRISYK